VPIWSADGTRIAFTSWRNGDWDLYQKATNGSGEEEVLFESNEGKFPSHWSSDGRFLAYTNQSLNRSSDVWVLPLFESRQPIPFAQTKFIERRACFSPNGRWPAYSSNESGREEVCVRPFPPSTGVWRVSTAGGTQPSSLSDFPSKQVTGKKRET